MADEFDLPDDALFPESEGDETFESLEHGESYPGGHADDLSTADLEEAYLRALEAMESAEWAVPETDIVEPESLAEADVVLEPTAVGTNTGDAVVEIAGADFLGGNPVAEPQANLAPAELPIDVPVENPTTRSSGMGNGPVSGTAPAKPARIVEACLFVGGQPLSARKLANLLDGNNDPADIEVLIDELNSEYAAQARPYEIRLGDGGYRLTLRSEFEAARNRVFGVGPRDVKLSQDVLEVLALVAYQQPVTHADIESCKPNSANTLRQLLRRELISLTRVDQSRNGVEYRTTQRFLQLFGLGQISELPRPEELSLR